LKTDAPSFQPKTDTNKFNQSFKEFVPSFNEVEQKNLTNLFTLKNSSTVKPEPQKPNFNTQAKEFKPTSKPKEELKREEPVKSEKYVKKETPASKPDTKKEESVVESTKVEEKKIEKPVEKPEPKKEVKVVAKPVEKPEPKKEEKKPEPVKRPVLEVIIEKRNEAGGKVNLDFLDLYKELGCCQTKPDYVDLNYYTERRKETKIQTLNDPNF